jgi:anthranilate synthase component 2
MAPRLLVIDNYDSFTYNLVQELGELGADLVVYRNDAIEMTDIEAIAPDGILISPGPGRPADAGISEAIIRQLGGRYPLLGVCLGHQAIGEVFGASVVNAPSLMHGKVSEVHHDGTGLFEGLPNPFTATRYHSLTLDPASIPDDLIVTARTDDGVIMGVRHRERAIHGVQFHPESILTPDGPALLNNFLGLCR